MNALWIELRAAIRIQNNLLEDLRRMKQEIIYLKQQIRDARGG